ncbi:MAG: hypothetical protein ACTSUO_00775 [Candidatus Thorarchaeota archaeon]
MKLYKCAICGRARFFADDMDAANHGWHVGQTGLDYCPEHQPFRPRFVGGV